MKPGTNNVQPQVVVTRGTDLAQRSFKFFGIGQI